MDGPEKISSPALARGRSVGPLCATVFLPCIPVTQNHFCFACFIENCLSKNTCEVKKQICKETLKIDLFDVEKSMFDN